MRLIIGGAGQGKLDYALKKMGLDPSAVALDPAQAADKPILYHLEAWVKANPAVDHLAALEELLAVNPGLVSLCDEGGCGVVPIAREERAWREAVGRLCCALAQRADTVERIFCGIPMTLKGDSAGN